METNENAGHVLRILETIFEVHQNFFKASKLLKCFKNFQNSMKTSAMHQKCLNYAKNICNENLRRAARILNGTKNFHKEKVDLKINAKVAKLGDKPLKIADQHHNLHSTTLKYSYISLFTYLNPKIISSCRR